MSTETKKMSVVQLTILTFINMAGSGIIMLPSKLRKWAPFLCCLG